jgi:peptide/nickel transport system permease protein
MRGGLPYLWYFAKRRPLFFFGVIVVVLSVVLAAVGPLVGPWDPNEANPIDFSQPPSARHLFGTDPSGMDVFSRVLAAPRTDVTIGLVVAVSSSAVGIMLGLLAGFYGGRGSEVLMRISDVVQSFPSFVLAMIMVALAGRQTTNIMLTLTVLYTPIFIRLTRSEVLSLKERRFVEAARAIGNSELAIAVRHVLPNALGPALAQLSVTVGWGILLTAGLSFVGAGVRPPTAEWGAMIAAGATQIILGEWWPSVFPGIAISITVFGYACVADGLQQLVTGWR